MANIKFIGRGKELKEIQKIKENFFLIVKGRRRIGKTLLLRKAFPEAVYIFIWPNKSLDWICQEICKENNLPSFSEFKDILEYLLDQNKIVILDEFQNLLNIDKSVYGEIQKIIDERKTKNKSCKIAVAGSSYSLMNKVFNDSASPLYGRRTHEILLKNISFSDLINELRIPFEDFIKLWSVFEGVPYYYELIDVKRNAKENIFSLIVSKNAQLTEEGNAILSVEFGKDSKTYATVISSIADGKTRLNEIASVFNNKKNEVIKYLNLLRKEFNLVKKITPLTENPSKSREGRYEILDNFLSFWFLVVDKQKGLFEQDRFKEIKTNFEESFNVYLGRKFEKFVLEMIKNNKILEFNKFEKIGPQWGKYPGKEGRNSYEIDILGLNESKKEILFGECKWKENVNSLEIFNKLSEKAKLVNWNLDKRKESFAVFAKSFSKRIQEFQGRKVYCFDLKDIEKALR
ncbi:MAG: ATP-binding protein [Candidatus Woesearchaeota archaeon]